MIPYIVVIIYYRLSQPALIDYPFPIELVALQKKNQRNFPHIDSANHVKESSPVESRDQGHKNCDLWRWEFQDPKMEVR